MPSDLMRPPLQPLTFSEQFVYPALACLLKAAVPYALLRIVVFLFPDLFSAHRHLHSIAFFAVHSFAYFMIIVAAIILSLGLILGRPTRSILKPSPTTPS